MSKVSIDYQAIAERSIARKLSIARKAIEAATGATGVEVLHHIAEWERPVVEYTPEEATKIADALTDAAAKVAEADGWIEAAQVIVRGVIAEEEEAARLQRRRKEEETT